MDAKTETALGTIVEEAIEKARKCELASLSTTEYEYDCTDKENGKRVKSKVELRFHKKLRNRQVALDIAPYVAITVIAIALCVIIKGCGASSANAGQQGPSACVKASASVQIDPGQVK